MGSRITWGIVGALASLIVSVAVAGTPAAATQDQPVVAGQTNTETNGTAIWNTGWFSLCSAFDNVGLRGCGEVGLMGKGTDTGVFGDGTSGRYGVEGTVTSSGAGVYGTAPSGDGVFGEGLIGVHGITHSTGNGVEGFANNSAASGVYGQNDGTGFGVAGRANGVGVLGDSANGVGVKANSPGGIALQVDGKARFDRSGVITIAFPAKSAVISGVPVTSTSLVLATEQKFLAGVYVVAAVPKLSGSSDSFTIYLNKAPGTSTTPKSVTVGWYVIEHP